MEQGTTVGRRFAVGEMVDLNVRGMRYAEEVPGFRVLTGTGLNGEPYELRLPYGGSDYTVTRVAPAEWPPVAGDIWADRDGDDWFAVNTGEHVELVSLAGAKFNPDTAMGAHGPMRLMYRRGWSEITHPETAQPDPTEVDKRAAYVAGLRELADFVESRTDLPVPGTGGGIPIYVELDELPAIAEQIGAEITRDDHIALVANRWFGPEVSCYLYASKPKPAPAPAEPVDQADEDAPVEREQDWWFTFGSGHTGPAGEDLSNHYIVLHGTYEGARNRMIELFDRGWAYQYVSAEAAGVDQYVMTRLVLGESAAS